jgi:hypothetical protein
MKRLAKAVGLSALLTLALGAYCAAPALAAFGLNGVQFSYEEEGGAPATEAGSHPFAVESTFHVNFHEEGGEVLPFEELKNLELTLPEGFAGNPTAVPTCAHGGFLKISPITETPSCPDDTAIGVVQAEINNPGLGAKRGVFNLDPPPGSVAEIGFVAATVPVTITFTLSDEAPYRVIAQGINVSQAVKVYGAKVTVWGNPANPVHDEERGACIIKSGVKCSAGGIEEKPFVTLPRACDPPALVEYSALSWQHPLGPAATGTSEAPVEVTDCEALAFESPEAGGEPTSSAGESASGLGFELNVLDPGLLEPEGIAEADIKKIEVTLPQGMSANPSAAEGLAACSKAQLDAETLAVAGGCPEASKLGTLEAQTPLLEGQTLSGSVYLASQADNPFNSLLALYMVIKDPELGVLVKIPTKVELDQATGQIKAITDNLPQLPLSRVTLQMRSGPRAPLVTPKACGHYQIQTTLTPYNNQPPITETQGFDVTSGPGGGPCIAAPGTFKPSFTAGTLSSVAGSYSPFVLRLSREDGSQQLSQIATTLPEGLLGKLAGISYCSDAQIALAGSRSTEGQGAIERTSPACPPASEVGAVTAAAGVGSELTYVKGNAYLAGPYKGAPLSLEIITPAIAGPFDLGVVAVRTALQVDPLTAQITAVSDPLPTILHGLPLYLRSIAIDMSRPGFTLNPTSCEPKTITGAATSILDQVAPLSQYFQASNCAGLGFRPSLKLSLKGQTRRAGHPGVRALLTYPKGRAYANVARAQVGLPHSEFLDQGNLNKVCTQPELKTQSCPTKSIYGHVKAWTPLLEKPVEGPVYLAVGFGYKLPALVAELNGQIRVLLVGKVDTGKNKGIRNTFQTVPDAPVEKFELTLKGGPRYGLLENSEDICRKTQKAAVSFMAQNGKVENLQPTIANSCRKGKKKKGKRHDHPGKGGK